MRQGELVSSRFVFLGGVRSWNGHYKDGGVPGWAWYITWGIMLAAIIVSLGLLAKAGLDELCFHNKEGAKKAVSVWAISMASLCLALGFTALIDHFSM